MDNADGDSARITYYNKEITHVLCSFAPKTSICVRKGLSHRMSME